MHHLPIQFSNLKKTTAVFLLCILFTNILFMFVLLPNKQAKATPDTTAAVEKQTAFQTVWQGLKAGWQAVDSAIQKVTSIFSGVSAATDLWSKAKDIAKGLLYAALQQMLYKIMMMITNDIINWINGGGTPKFVSDWNGFLKDAANEAGGAFLDTLTGGFLCKPFSFQLRLALMPVSYQQMSRCTLEQMGANMEAFFSNFSSGGWGTWLQVIQPQNNFYGAYLLAMNEKEKQQMAAMEAGKNEALSGGGFLGSKKCMSCTVGGEDGSSQTFNSMSECEQWKKAMSNGSPVAFKCNSEQMMTPPSIAQYEIQRAIDSGRELIQQQIAAITPHTDIMGIPLAPFFSAIFGALVNRVIGEGLGMMSGLMGGDDSSGNSSSSYYYNAVSQGQGSYADPYSNSFFNSQTAAVAGIDIAQDISASSPALIISLNLLDENIASVQTQQQNNLAVLNSISSSQSQTLSVLKSMIEENCSMPSWTTSQIISDDGTTQIIKITASNIGAITVKKTTTTSSIGTSSSVETQETSTAIAPQLAAMQADIDKTQEQVDSINDAITANRTAMADAENYQTLYENSLGSSLNQTTPQQLEDAEATLQDDYDAAITNTQKAAGSNETTLDLLVNDTNQQSQTAVTDAQTIESTRDSLNTQLSSANSTLSSAQSSLSSCQQANLSNSSPEE
jgi:hypothetical protein